MGDVTLYRFGLILVGAFAVMLVMTLAFKFGHATITSIATIVLALGTLALALVSYEQLIDSREAIRAAVNSATTAETALQTARENFRIEQRPIIWLTNDLGGPKFILNNAKDNTGQIVWGWHFTNYGKTPSVRMAFKHFMKIENASQISYGEPSGAVGAPLPPYKDDFTTVVSSPGISQEKFTQLMQKDNAIGISGEITYYDTYGEKYETTFCLGHLSSGAINYCKEGNMIR